MHIYKKKGKKGKLVMYAVLHWNLNSLLPHKWIRFYILLELQWD